MERDGLLVLLIRSATHGFEKRCSAARGLPHLQENFDFPAVK